MEITNYPDGTSYVDTCKLDTMKDVVFRLNEYKDIWHLKQFVDAANNLGEVPTIIIPNLIDAQADRRFDKGQSSGLKLVIQELASMNANFKIFHPHNSEVVEMGFEVLNKPVEIISNTDFVRRVLMRLDASCEVPNHSKNVENTILMSSDAGGFKPLMKLCDEIKWGGQVHSCSKGRSYNNNKSELTQRIGKEDFCGKDIVIIDDISVYGGTFKGLSTLLRQRNCGELNLVVSHMTMQNLGKNPVTDFFDRVFTTDSKFPNYYAPHREGGKQPDNLQIIKMF